MSAINLNLNTLLQIRAKFNLSANGYFDLPQIDEQCYIDLCKWIESERAFYFTLECRSESFLKMNSVLELFKDFQYPSIVFLSNYGLMTVLCLMIVETMNGINLVNSFLGQLNGRIDPTGQSPQVRFKNLRSIDNLELFFNDMQHIGYSSATILNSGDLFLFYSEYVQRYSPPEPIRIAPRILKIMEQYSCYTLTTLTKFHPELIKSYLDDPSLPMIISNCAAFFLSGTSSSTRGNVIQNMLKLKHVFAHGNYCKILAFLKYQNININEFTSSFYNVFCRKNSKQKCLAILGASDTGKTAFLRPLMDIFLSGEIIGDNWENCAYKALLYCEDLRVTPSNLIKFLRIMEGLSVRGEQSSCCVEPMTIKSTPVVITSSESDPWALAPSKFASRVFSFTFSKPGAEFPTFRFCNAPNVVCPAQKAYPLFTVSPTWSAYWLKYSQAHQKCHSSCAHCSPATCHFVFNKEENDMNEVCECIQHNLIHEVENHAESSRRSSARIQSSSPSEVIDTNLEAVSFKYLKSKINGCDWIDFILSIVVEYENTHK